MFTSYKTGLQFTKQALPASIMDICRNENNNTDDNEEVSDTSDLSETDKGDIFSDGDQY